MAPSLLSNEQQSAILTDSKLAQSTPQSNGAIHTSDVVSDSAGKIFGMENFGNTCYCNSVIQCLYYSKPFREHVLGFPHPSESSPTKPLRKSVPGLHPHPFTVDPASAKISTSTGSAESTHAQTQAALVMASQARANGYDYSTALNHSGVSNPSSSAASEISKKQSASESKSLGRRMSLFGKSSSSNKNNSSTTTNGNATNTNDATHSSTAVEKLAESTTENLADSNGSNPTNLAEVTNAMFDSNGQTSYPTSKLLYPGLKGIMLGVRYPGQNIPVVGFTDDPFATQETRKRSALVKGPIINLDLSYADNYNMKESLFTSLKDIFECMAENQSRIGVVSPCKLIEVLKRENELFRSSMHQDAHEFLNFLLNEVIENIDRQNRLIGSSKIGVSVNAGQNGTSTPTSSSATTPTSRSRWVHDLFEGLLTSETKCLTCETVSRRDEQFLDLSIDIERNSSVTACLRQFSASEMLCERNKFNCDNCGGLHEAEKRMKVKKLPKILALHLKRFKYTEDLQRNVKLFHRVVYPKHLRLDNTTHDAQDKDKLYELYAVVVHIGGGPYHGHYVSVVKTETSGWLLFDDEMVEGVDPTYVFNFFGDNKGLATAYVLFYQEISHEQYERENLYTNTAPAGAGITTAFNTPTATAVPSINPSTTGLPIHVNSPPVASPTPVSAMPPNSPLDMHPSATNTDSASESIPIPNSHHNNPLLTASSTSLKASALSLPKRTQTNESVSDTQEDFTAHHLSPIRDTDSAPQPATSPQRHLHTSHSGLSRFKTSSSNCKSLVNSSHAASSNSSNSGTSSGIHFWKKKDLKEDTPPPVETKPDSKPDSAAHPSAEVQKKKSRHLSFTFKKH